MNFKQLKVQELNAENFKDYGKVITVPVNAPDGMEKEFNWWGNVAELPAEGRVSTGILQVKYRDFKVPKVEYHAKTAEMLVPLKGNSILVVGRKSPDCEQVQKLEAFYFNENKLVVMDESTLHWIPFPLEKEATYAVVFRSQTPDDDLSFIEFDVEPKIIL